MLKNILSCYVKESENRKSWVCPLLWIGMKKCHGFNPTLAHPSTKLCGKPSSCVYAFLSTIEATNKQINKQKDRGQNITSLVEVIKVFESMIESLCITCVIPPPPNPFSTL